MNEQEEAQRYERKFGRFTLKRTRRSWTVYSHNLHLALFTLGFHLKRRKGTIWYHNRMRLHEPSKEPLGRGTRTYEWDRWKTTRPLTGAGPSPYRVGLKSFVRFKIGFGGEPDAAYEENRRALGAAKLERLDKRGQRDALIKKLALKDHKTIAEIRTELGRHGFAGMSRTQVERAITRIRRARPGR